MRVAIVQEHVDSGRGGAETSTLEMARHLAQIGLDVTVVCRGELSQPLIDQNVTILPLAAGGISRAARTYRFVQAAGKLCRAERFDIVHAVTPCLAANVYQPRGGTYPETIARSLAMVQPPWLHELKRFGRRLNVRQRFLYRVERLLLTKYAGRVFVAALSDYVRRQVETGIGFPAERVRVVFNGVDIAPLEAAERVQQRAVLRARFGLNDDLPLVLFVAHNFRLKGLAELLRAAAAARTEGSQRGWTVAVVGRDNPRPYAQLARQLGVAAQVRFVGTQAPIRSWYAAADVLAHPTWYDPCSRVVLEALSVGLPVVTTAYNGAAEVIESGQQGEVVAEPDDIAGLAAALGRTLRPGVRAACRDAAPRMHGLLSMSRHARELKALYEELTASP